mmetsp:Transcript_9762/g.18279  ORF Transcript_9762/g.18279 Transcript_9762/m.18279 type:complete len:992 (+) Transcript_9762:327-3302(+)
MDDSTFERLVQEEMARQLKAVRSQYEDTTRASENDDEKLGNGVNPRQSNDVRGQYEDSRRASENDDQDRTRANGSALNHTGNFRPENENGPLSMSSMNPYPSVDDAFKAAELDLSALSATNALPSSSNTIGFGRGITTLGTSPEDLERMRRLETDKKLIYQRELDRQLEEKRTRARQENPGHQTRNHINVNRESRRRSTGGSVLPFRDSFEERQLERKKREDYAKELQDQMAERERLKKSQGGFHHGHSKSDRMAASGLTLSPTMLDEHAKKQRERQRQEEYARVLQEQMKEREHKKLLEKQAAEDFDRRYGNPSPQQATSQQSVFGSPPSDPDSRRHVAREHEQLDTLETPDPFIHNRARFRFGNMDPIQQEDLLKKQMQQQQVQLTLKEQIEERKRRATEEKRKQAELEAAEEERIRRDLEELKVAYEREHAPPRVALSPPRTEAQPQPLASVRSPMTANGTSLQASSFHESSFHEFDAPRLSAKNDDDSVRMLAADLVAKREEVMAMKRHQEDLERELNRQKEEIQHLKQIQMQMSPPPPQSYQHPSAVIQQPYQQQSGQYQQYAQNAPPPPTLPLRQVNSPPRPVQAPAFESRPKVSNSIDLSYTNNLEHSMPSQSKLVQVCQRGGQQHSGRLDETWRGDTSRSSLRKSSNPHRELSSVKELGEYEPSPAPRETYQVDEYEDEELNIAEQSLPCASRYFVYVSQKSEDEDKKAPAKTPMSFTPREGGEQGWDEHIDDMNDFERSRVRTAQAARVALQRASAHSEDEDSYASERRRRRQAKKLEQQEQIKQTYVKENGRRKVGQGARQSALERVSLSSSSSSASSGVSSLYSVGSRASASSSDSDGNSTSSPKRRDELNRTPSKSLQDQNLNDLNLDNDVDSKPRKFAVQTPPRESKPGSGPKKWSKQFEPFRVYRNVGEGALSALESASRKREKKASLTLQDTNELEGGSSGKQGGDDDYSEEFSSSEEDDEYVAYGSEDERIPISH